MRTIQITQHLNYCVTRLMRQRFFFITDVFLIHDSDVCCQLISVRHKIIQYRFHFVYLATAGPSRATAGPGETFLRAFKHFHGAPLGRKFLIFFENGTFWRTL